MKLPVEFSTGVTIVFIHVIFNDAFNNSDYVSSNGKIMVNNIGKDVEGSGCGLISDTIPEFSWRY
jgi:hypothetical protein